MDNIASIIDQTLLRPDSVFGDYTVLVRQAVKNSFATVCINPFFVPLVNNILKNHPQCPTKICSVISFPFGLNDIHSKCEEIDYVIAHGAKELDLVANLSAIKTHDFKRFEDELRAVKEESQGYVLKVILETGLLTDDEIRWAADCLVSTHCNFAKTSTGINCKLEPAKTASHVKLLKEHLLGTPVLVKASGGIKTLEHFNLMVEAGADRIGTSSGVEILEEKTNG
jgi:deoxyribose-phosphate aldolase